jgi:hypothetical protein
MSKQPLSLGITPLSNIVQFVFSEKKRFIDRFVLYMLRHGDGSVMPHGRPVREYAMEVAAIYWEESLSDHLTPEEHAESDMSFWAEDFGFSSEPRCR